MSRDRFARSVPLMAGVALALPLLVIRAAPMTDLAHHEGMVALLVHARDPAFTRGIYALNLGHANQLFYALAWPLALVLGSTLACRLVVAAIVVATFASASKLCDHLGTTRWAALLVAPAAMGWTFFFGFAPNLLGVALFMAILPRFDALAAEPTMRRAIGSSFAVVALHAAHETSAICACVAIAVLSLGRAGRASSWALRAAPIALAALLAGIEMHREKAVLTAFGQRWIDQGIALHPIDQKLEHVLDFLMGPQGALAETLVAGLALAALVAFWIARPRIPSGSNDARSLGARLVHHRFAILGATFFALYVVAPFSINFGAFLYVRFLVPAYVVLVLVAARGAVPSPIAKGLAVAVPLAWLAVVLPVFADADRERRAVDALFPRIEEGSAVAVLSYTGNESLHPYDPLSLGNRVLAERGGRALHSFAEYPIAPMVVRPEMRWDEAMMRIYINPTSLRPAFDLTRFRYLLVRIPEDDRAMLVERALVPDATRVASEGGWHLFESTHEVVAVDAPDAPLPRPLPATLQERVSAVVGRKK